MSEGHITVGFAVHGGIDLQFGNGALSSKVSLTTVQANWLIDELTNKLRGKRRPRKDMMSEEARRLSKAHAPGARQVYEALPSGDDVWKLIREIANQTNTTSLNVRSQLHALKHAGYVECRLGNARGENGVRLVEWRIKTGVTYDG